MKVALQEESLARIRSMLFSTAAEGLIVVDDSGIIQLLNPRTTALFGYDEDELTGRPIEVLIPTERRGRHAQIRKGYHENPIERPMGAGLELFGQRKDGSTFPVEVGLNHFTVDGRRYVMALIHDITVRWNAENELRRTNAELEQRVRVRTSELLAAQRDLRQALEAEKELNVLKSRFVSMASHEFRTPLSTIMGSVDLIARYNEGPQGDKVVKHVTRIRAKVRELTAMLNDFLSLEKLEQGQARCAPVQVDLVHLCIKMIEELQDIAKPGQEINYDHQGEERMVYHDQQMLSNVLSNLLSNAIKYSPEDKRIDLITSISDGSVKITVRDEGMGIPERDQEHLFERFFRAHNALTIQGTGLGLNIVRKFLDLMGGSIRYESELGKGTTFTVVLPKEHVDENTSSDRR